MDVARITLKLISDLNFRAERYRRFPKLIVTITGIMKKACAAPRSWPTFFLFFSREERMKSFHSEAMNMLSLIRLLARARMMPPSNPTWKTPLRTFRCVL